METSKYAAQLYTVRDFTNLVKDTCYRNPFESLEISLDNIRKW